MRRSEAWRSARFGGRYRIEGELARGGMGQVLLVRHRELDKPFALKLLGAAGADPEARAAFYREARVAAALDHPHIVQIHDFGDDERHGLYLVMELLPGETAAGRLARERRLAPIAACDIAAQTADALDYVHARGLVHGDVKPENVFLSPSPSGAPAEDARRNYVRLLDFGLSRPRAPRDLGSTGRAFVEGTPAYLAPELTVGGAPTPASDLYALGVSLFELAAGRPPFSGAVADVMQDHLASAPPTVAATRGEPVAPEVEAIVARLLDKDPARRGADAHAVATELRACVAALGGRRKLLPRAVAGRSRLAEAVVDDTPAGVFVVSPTSVLLFANPAMEALLHRTAADGVQLGSTHLGEIFPRIERDVRAVLARGTHLRRQAVAPDGTTVLLTLSPHRRDGQVVGVSGLVIAL